MGGCKETTMKCSSFFVFSENWDKGGLTLRHHLGVFVCGWVWVGVGVVARATRGTCLPSNRSMVGRYDTRTLLIALDDVEAFLQPFLTSDTERQPCGAH